MNSLFCLKIDHNITNKVTKINVIAIIHEVSKKHAVDAKSVETTIRKTKKPEDEKI